MKPTEDDIEVVEWRDQYVLEITNMMSKRECEELKTQILVNQEKAEIINELEKDGKWCDVLEYVKKSKIQLGENIATILLLDQENKQLKETLCNIRSLFYNKTFDDAQSDDLETFCEKLDKLLTVEELEK